MSPRPQGPAPQGPPRRAPPQGPHPRALTFMLATANVLFSRYFPSFWGYVYSSTSLIWGEGAPSDMSWAQNARAGRVLEHH